MAEHTRAGKAKKRSYDNVRIKLYILGWKEQQHSYLWTVLSIVVVLFLLPLFIRNNMKLLNFSHLTDETIRPQKKLPLHLLIMLNLLSSTHISH